MRNTIVLAVICLTASLAASHPVSRRSSPSGCSNLWPLEATDCSFANQLSTPLDIKRVIVFTEAAIFQLLPTYDPVVHCNIGCSDPFPLAGHFCENPSFPLNPHYALRDTDADNIISNSLLAQRLAWSISDHYSSLDSFTVNILNSSNSDTPNMDLLVNVSQFIQQSIFPFLGDIQFQGAGCPAHAVTLLNYSDISCASSSDQVDCIGLQLAFTIKSLRNHIRAYLNLNVNHELRTAVNDIPQCAVYGTGPLAPREFRKMTCGARQLASETYRLIKALMPVTSTVNCSDYSSGITSWLGYFEEGMFPPTSPLNMTVYASYLKALMEHSNALATIQINSLSSVNLEDSVSIVSSILSNVTPKFQQWLSSKACDCTNSACALPDTVSVDPASLGSVGRNEYYKQLYCQVQDLRSTAESTYLFLTLLPEAFETWSVPCSAV